MPIFLSDSNKQAPFCALRQFQISADRQIFFTHLLWQLLDVQSYVHPPTFLGDASHFNFICIYCHAALIGLNVELIRT